MEKLTEINIFRVQRTTVYSSFFLSDKHFSFEIRLTNNAAKYFKDQGTVMCSWDTLNQIMNSGFLNKRILFILPLNKIILKIAKFSPVSWISVTALSLIFVIYSPALNPSHFQHLTVIKGNKI